MAIFQNNIASSGIVGPTGATGPIGSTGPTGPTGSTGPTISLSSANTRIIYATGTDTIGSIADFTYDSATGTLGLLGTNAEILMRSISTEPASPSANQLYVYAKSHASRMMLKYKGPSGLDTTIQPNIFGNKVAWWSPPGNSTTVPAVIGFNALTAQGTVTARNVATTNLFTRTKRLGYVSAATAGSIAGHYDTVAQYTIGDGAGLGGFYYVCRFGASDAAAQSTAKVFVGFTSSVAAATNVEPSTLTNCIGVGADSGDTNLSIYYGGSAAQTRIGLGASFPKSSASTNMYELVLFAPTNVNNSVSYRVTNLTSGAATDGVLTAATPGTQLPASTTLLAHRAWRITGAAAAVGIDVVSVYLETDY